MPLPNQTMRLRLRKAVFALVPFLLVVVSFLGASNDLKACDTSPVITASNPQDIGGGFFTFDLQVCIGTDGSQDGFDVTMNCGLNITATSAASLNNGGRIATSSIAGGVLTYSYGGFPPTWWEPDDGISGPCFNFTLTVDGDPSGCSATVTGVNDNCLIFTTAWSATVPTIPGPCIPDFTMTAPGTQAGNTSGAGNDCPSRGSQDQIIEINIPCDDDWTFDVCGASWDTYLFLSTSCCGTTASNDDNCGLQSSITRTLTAGTYYVTVEAFSTSTTGSYTLNVTSANPCILPVKMSYFNGGHNQQMKTNELKWMTESELNNDYFIIQRSNDANNYSDIGIVEGNGNSNTPIIYEFEDKNPLEGLNYYRLKQVDFNGDYEYSGMVAINVAKSFSNAVSDLYPNPTSNSFAFKLYQGTEDNLSVQIYDGFGKLVKSLNIKNTNSDSYQMSTNGIAPGIYYVSIQVGDQSYKKKLAISED